MLAASSKPDFENVFPVFGGTGTLDGTTIAKPLIS